MYDIRLVRSLCKCISAEEDPQKAESLINLLTAVVRENSEETAMRMELIKKEYRAVLSRFRFGTDT